MNDKVYAVYMLASRKNGTLYIGVTGDLISRVSQHKSKELPGFTSKYDVHQLVWFENSEDVSLAIQCEKTMKKWPRQWKINLIEKNNPYWQDLYAQLL